MASSIAATSAASVSSTDALAGCSSSGLSVEERLLALVVYSQASQMSEAKTTVNLNAEQLEKLREQVKQALAEAREAEKDSGFWGGLSKLFSGDLATLAAAVAAVAAVVATGGAAAAVLAVVAAAASFAAEHAEELGIPKEVAMGIAIAASVAALACGNGQGLLNVSKSVAQTAHNVQIGAQVAQGTFVATGGGCQIVEGKYERDAGYANADARQAQGQQELTSADIDEALDQFAAALEHQNRAAKLTGSIAQQSSASSYAILNNWGGAA
jgi:hypothetical protein